MRSDALETPAFLKHARKGSIGAEGSTGYGSLRTTVRMCSRAAESSEQVMITIWRIEVMRMHREGCVLKVKGQKDYQRRR